MRLTAALAFLHVASCHVRLGAIGPHGPKPLIGWRELKSAHFVVDADVQESQPQGLVNELEEQQALIGSDVEIPGRIRAIG